MPATGMPAVKSIVERLKANLEREPTLRGDALLKAVEEKELLLSELEQSLRLDEEGSAQRVKELEPALADLAIANRLALKFNRMLLQLSRLRKPQAEAMPAQRVDLIS